MAQAGEWGGSRRRSRGPAPEPQGGRASTEQHRQGEVHLGGEPRKSWLAITVRAVPEQFSRPIRESSVVSCPSGRMNCPTVAGRAIR